MERFVQRQNVSRFKNLLLRVTDDVQRQQIQELLAEEEAKDPYPKLASRHD